MYANLKVLVGDETLYAHEVDVTPNEVVVHLDSQDGTGKYAEPAGERRFPLGTPLEILADF